VGGEFVAAFADEIFDQAAAAFDEELFTSSGMISWSCPGPRPEDPVPSATWPLRPNRSWTD
jgi:hypothetical protein